MGSSSDLTEVLHLALRTDWQSAVEQGSYDCSTLGVSLAEQGFIHASADADQVRRVHGYVYRELPAADLVLLRWPLAPLGEVGIDCRLEPGDPADPSSEQFPHLYGGPVPVALTWVADAAWLDRHGLSDLVAPRP